MTQKTLHFPLTKEQLEELTRVYPTPFYLYDEKAIRQNLKDFIAAFNDFPIMKEFFAVKAMPNPYMLKILAQEKAGCDCSSLPELMLAERAGIRGENVMFTSNETPAREYAYAARLGNIINLDDITHIDYLKNALDGTLPELLCFRYNPGNLKTQGVNAIIGEPTQAKYGITTEQIIPAYKAALNGGVKRFGLHAMLASNELSVSCFSETAALLFSVAVKLKEELGIKLEFIDMGGGLGIPYKPGQLAVNYKELSLAIKQKYDEIIVKNELDPLSIFWECGRPITGPYGYLVTRAIHKKHIYKEYIGVDASMADLMRPGMYKAYHHISVMGKDDVINDAGEIIGDAKVVDVVGSLCENCDKFAVDRPLPPIEIGDLLVIHDAGAHGRAMGFNYNGKLRAGELLLRADGSVIQIRRAETISDYFATLDFSGLGSFE